MWLLNQTIRVQRINYCRNESLSKIITDKNNRIETTSEGEHFWKIGLIRILVSGERSLISKITSREQSISARECKIVGRGRKIIVAHKRSSDSEVR